MIKAVFIDIDNTLLDFNACAKTAIKIILEEYNHEYSEKIFQVFLKVNGELWEMIEQGTLTRPRLHEIRWKLIFDELGIKIDGPEFEKCFIKTLVTCAEPVPGALDVLKYLSSKYPVYAVSNAAHDQQYSRLSKAGMSEFIKYVFISEQIGASKPQKEFFDGCFEKLPGLCPGDVVIIGDSLSADIRGGGAYGIRTCWFNYFNEELPDDINPDWVVNKLCDIKKIF